MAKKTKVIKVRKTKEKIKSPIKVKKFSLGFLWLKIKSLFGR